MNKRHSSGKPRSKAKSSALIPRGPSTKLSMLGGHNFTSPFDALCHIHSAKRTEADLYCTYQAAIQEFPIETYSKDQFLLQLWLEYILLCKYTFISFVAIFY